MRARSGKKVSEGPRLGFRPAFVLAKLGHDLREHYTDLVNAPLPEEIERPLERLRDPGADADDGDQRQRR